MKKIALLGIMSLISFNICFASMTLHIPTTRMFDAKVSNLRFEKQSSINFAIYIDSEKHQKSCFLKFRSESTALNVYNSFKEYLKEKDNTALTCVDAREDGKLFLAKSYKLNFNLDN